MGAQQSNTLAVNDIVQEAITNVLMESSQNCSATSNNNQTMQFSDFNCGGDFNMSGINQSIQIKQNFSCAQDNNQSTDLQTKLKQELNNKLESATSGVGIGFNSSNSEAYNNIKNKILNNIDIKTMAKCMSDSMQNQSLIVEKINSKGNCNINNINQQITAELVTNCMQSNTNLVKAISELESKVSNDLKAKTEGISGFGIFGILIALALFFGMLGIYGNKIAAFIAILLILGLIGYVFYWFFLEPTKSNYCFISTNNNNNLTSIFYKSDECDNNSNNNSNNNNSNDLNTLSSNITGFNKSNILYPSETSKFCYGMSDNNISFLKKVNSKTDCTNINKIYNYPKTKYNNNISTGNLYLYTKKQPDTNQYCYGNIINKDNNRKQSMIIPYFKEGCTAMKNLGVYEGTFWA